MKKKQTGKLGDRIFFTQNSNKIQNVLEFALNLQST